MGTAKGPLKGAIPDRYRVLKEGWFKGGGYKISLGNLKGTLGSTREN